jgi:hypothetical protein
MKGVHNRVVVAALATALAAGLAAGGGLGCGDDARCGPGTVLAGDQCVPDGSVICPQGTTFVDGACQLDDSACAAGTVLIDGHCVADDGAIPVDLEEHAEPNDDPALDAPAGGFALGPQGTALVLHGCVLPRADLDGNGNLDPDRDVWLVTTDAPATVEITADGVGGLVAGFAVIAADPALAQSLRTYQRFGINLTSDTAARQVYLPQAGTYALVMTDARSLLLGGTGAGGPGACYYTTVRRVATPAPVPLTAPQTATDDRGQVRLFAFDPATRGRVVRVTVNTSSSAMMPAFVVLRGAAATLQATVRGNRTSVAAGGLEPHEPIVVVSDMEYDWGLTPQAYTYDVVDLEARPLPADGTVTLTKKNGLNPFAVYADYEYFYFDLAAAGTIVRFDVSATSAAPATPLPIDLVITRRDVLNASDVVALVEPFGEPGRPGGFVGEYVRFAQPGRYYLVLQDPNGTSGDTYTLSSRWAPLPSTPVQLGTPTASAPLPPGGSAFHTLELTAPIWIEAGVTASGFPAGAGSARVSLYDLAGSGWLGGNYLPVVSAPVSSDGSDPLGRVLIHDNRDYLGRVDAIGAPAAGATYSLAVRDRDHVELGTLSPAAAIDRDGVDVVPAAVGGVAGV